MAGDIPQFHRGRSGKVTAKHMNSMAETSRLARNDLEQTSMPGAREAVHSPGAWPMMVRVGPQLFEGKQVIGYAWQEVMFNQGMWVSNLEGRRWDETENNYIVPYGIDRGSLGKTNFTEKIVIVNFAHSPSGLVLYFQPDQIGEGGGPGPQAETKVGQIIQGGLNCAINQGQFYNVQIVSVRDISTEFAISFQSAGDVVPAINLIELTSANLGGSVSSSDCDIATSVQSIPVGTYVQVFPLKKLYIDNNDGLGEVLYDLHGFSVVNDLCVSCCGELPAASVTTQATVHNRIRADRIRSRSSIIQEMQR